MMIELQNVAAADLVELDFPPPLVAIGRLRACAFEGDIHEIAAGEPEIFDQLRRVVSTRLDRTPAIHHDHGETVPKGPR